MSEDATTCLFQAASPGYFRSMGIAVVRGRAFTDRDTASEAPVIVIEEALANSSFRTPIRSASGSPSSSRAATVRMRSPSGAKWWASSATCATTAWFASRRTWRSTRRSSSFPSGSALAVRPWRSSCAPRFRRSRSRPPSGRRSPHRSRHPGLRHPDDGPVCRSDDGAVAPEHEPAGVFGGLALVLSSLGIYGVLSYTGQPAARRRSGSGWRSAPRAAT